MLMRKERQRQNEYCSSDVNTLNPVSPNIHKQILQTGLHTFR